MPESKKQLKLQREIAASERLTFGIPQIESPNPFLDMTTSKKILRWICAVPAGIIGAALVMFPLHWLVMINHGGWGMDPIIEIRDPNTLKNIESILQAAFGPLAFVYFSARTAPSNKRMISFLFSGIIVIGLPILASQWNAHTISAGHGFLIEQGIARTLANFVGAAGAIYMIHNYERKGV